MRRLLRWLRGGESCHVCGSLTNNMQRHLGLYHTPAELQQHAAMREDMVPIRHRRLLCIDEEQQERVARCIALTYTDGACDLECPLCDCDGMQQFYADHATREVLMNLGLTVASTDRSSDRSTGSVQPIARTDGRTD